MVLPDLVVPIVFDTVEAFLVGYDSPRFVTAEVVVAGYNEMSSLGTIYWNSGCCCIYKLGVPPF